MKKRSMGAAWALTLALSPLCGHAQQAFTPSPAQVGRWVTESGNLEVDIAPCGEAWCGTVTQVLANRSMSAPGQTMDAADKRPALGMKILTELRLADEGVLSGQIYNRENAKTYSVRLTMDGPQQLLVRPYIGLPLFGKTQLWRRVPVTSQEPKP
jgi:uncharacterized protein (DUF2147 family)